MNVTGIKRAEDWPFPMPDFLKKEINELVDAMTRDDENLDGYQDNLEGCARNVPERENMILYDYYLRGGWCADVD